MNGSKLEQTADRMKKFARASLVLATISSVAAVYEGILAATSGRAVVLVLSMALFSIAAMVWANWGTAASMAWFARPVLESMEDAGHHEHGGIAESRPGGSSLENRITDCRRQPERE
jgi:hypothetical protein